MTTSAPTAAEPRRGLNRDTLAGVGLAFVGGFIDAAAFIALSGLFTAHVTGNFVMLGAELVSTSSGVLAKLLALPVFILAVAGTRLASVLLERRKWPVLRLLLGLEALVLAGFAVAGLLLSPLGSPDSAPSVLVGMLGVTAMGVQNAINRLVLGHLAATTVMTVNVTQNVIDAVDLLRGAAGETARARLRRMLPPVGAFAAGALAGAFGVAAWSFWSVAVPTLVLLLLVVFGAAPPKAGA